MKLAPKNPLTNADALLTIEGIPGYWTKFSGVKETQSRPVYSDGLTSRKRYARTGTSEFADVEFSRPFDPELGEDISAYQAIQTAKFGNEMTLTVRPVKREGELLLRGKRAWNISGARVKEYSVMESIDTGEGNAVVEFKVSFTVDDIVWA
jgi:hypothetical protein